VQMQTGPRPRQRMHSWLSWTGSVEIANILIFSWLLWLVISGRPGPWPFGLLGLATLDLLLFQGGLYWLSKRRITASRWPPLFRLRFLRLLYAANTLLLLIFPLAILLGLTVFPTYVRSLDLLLGLGYYLFGVGEFVHYFLFKINMRPRELRLAWSRRRLVRARLWRELTRAEAQAQSAQSSNTG
jgi:hypothetical protein